MRLERRRGHRQFTSTCLRTLASPTLHSYREWNHCEHCDVYLPDEVMSPTNITPLLKGTVDLLILQALRQGPSHGYEISRFVRERTEGVLTVEDAALYQALHRLEARKWIESEWGLSDNNRRAKYYELTSAGRSQLRSGTSVWRRYANAVFKVLETT
jgi:PadR family transcriptional regulator PadR